jgi:TolB-like protein
VTIIASAADTPKPALTVAVYDFTADPDAASYVKNVTTLVTVNLTTETNLVLLERATLAKALQEQPLGISGMVSSDAAAKIGQITGAKVLVSGQVVKVGDNHLVLIADIIGTETGRLFAAKVEGAADNLMALTDRLSRKIAQTIRDQTANLTAPPQETSAERLDRIIKNTTGTNRPSVSVNLNGLYEKDPGKSHVSTIMEGEFGAVLLKAGFPLADEKSDRKPDIVISGSGHGTEGPRQGDLFSFVVVVDVKVQERRTGRILALEHLAASATGGASGAAEAAALVNAVDGICDRALPLLAQ